jgi:iron-sulfur cluster assembly accessory protein
MLPDGDHMLYVGVKGGGCSGMQYVFQILKYDPIKHFAYDMFVCSDTKSSLFLKNCTLKYKMSVGASILVVENPNAVSTCGCGESFSL